MTITTTLAPVGLTVIATVILLCGYGAGTGGVVAREPKHTTGE